MLPLMTQMRDIWRPFVVSMIAFSPYVKADNCYLQNTATVLGVWHSCSLPRDTGIQDVTNPHVLSPHPTYLRSTLPCPTPTVFEISEEFIPQKWHFWRWKTRTNEKGPTNQPIARSFTPSKLIGIFLKQISAYSSSHQAFLNRLWCLRTPHSLSLLVTLSIAIPAIAVSTWIIMCCLHFSFTPRKICV